MKKLILTLFAVTALVAVSCGPDDSDETRNYYSINVINDEINRDIKSVYYFYDNFSDGYTFHFFDESQPVFEDEYYSSEYNAITIDIAGTALGKKCSLLEDPQSNGLVNFTWECYVDTYDNEFGDGYGNRYGYSPVYISFESGYLEIDMSSEVILSVDMEYVGEDGVSVKLQFKGEANRLSFYPKPLY